jgi:hypothetical protein
MTSITKRPVPEGYSQDWDQSIWNVGVVFEWSKYYKKFLLRGRISLKPGETLVECLERHDYRTNGDFEVFFVEE